MCILLGFARLCVFAFCVSMRVYDCTENDFLSTMLNFQTLGIYYCENVCLLAWACAIARACACLRVQACVRERMRAREYVRVPPLPLITGDLFVGL